MFIEEQADRAKDPAAARELAQRMRLRASELEAGVALSDDDEAVRLLSETFDEPAE